VHAPPGDAVDVHVKGQPASKVLELLLDDGNYVVKRDGTLVSVERDTTPAASAASSTGAAGIPAVPPIPPIPVVPPIPAVPPVPPVPAVGSAAAVATSASSPAPTSTDVSIKIGSGGSEIVEPHKHGEDRTVMGGGVTIAKGDTARDVTVFGGNVDIEGEVTGDVTVFGGIAHVHQGGRVRGDAEVYGGTLQLDTGARVDGDVSAAGGSLVRDPGSVVGGDVTVTGGHDRQPGEAAAPAAHVGGFRHAASSFIDGVRLAAVLFVVGTVLLALAGRRMEALRVEAASRPMRSMAMGLLGTFGGSVILIALTVTVIGAPIALVAAILAAFGVLAAMCAVLSVVGEALLRHKTENPYVHLAVGCGLFVALSAIPWVGHIAVLCVVLAGVGVLVATRGAGFFVRKNGGRGPSSGSAYRTEPAI
jgi:cytoskeletal protein CcmA (bactofilin family)